MKLTFDFGSRSYPVILKRGAIARVGRLADLSRRVMLVTDAGVPAKYVKSLLRQCRRPCSVVLPAGRPAAGAWAEITARMLAEGFGPGDAVLALGGNGVGDVAGFAAAAYLGGVACIRVPTTAAAQLDGAVGGWSRLAQEGRPDALAVLHQPELVVADPDLLDTLPRPRLAAGLAYAVRTALARSRELYEILERDGSGGDIERVLFLCLQCKKELVERDEALTGEGRLLELGQPVSRALQAACGPCAPPRGACLALGLLPMLDSRTLAKRTRALLRRLGLPLEWPCPVPEVLRRIKESPYQEEGLYTIARVKAPGRAYLERVDYEELRLLLGGGEG